MNKSHFALSIVIGCVLVAEMSFADDAKKDSDAIQGTWAAVIYVQDGEGEDEAISPEDSPIRWMFKGDQITFLADVDEASAKGTFKLNPSKKPKLIDIAFPPLPGAKKGQNMLGIYEVEGDALKICYGPDGASRPTDFKSKAGSKNIMVVFKPLKK